MVSLDLSALCSCLDLSGFGFRFLFASTRLRPALPLHGVQLTFAGLCLQQLLINGGTLGDLLVLDVEVDGLFPRASESMKIDGNRGVDDLSSFAGHDPNLENRCSGSTLLGFHAEQDAPNLPTLIKERGSRGFISGFGLLPRQCLVSSLGSALDRGPRFTTNALAIFLQREIFLVCLPANLPTNPESVETGIIK